MDVSKLFVVTQSIHKTSLTHLNKVQVLPTSTQQIVFSVVVLSFSNIALARARPLPSGDVTAREGRRISWQPLADANTNICRNKYQNVQIDLVNGAVVCEEKAKYLFDQLLGFNKKLEQVRVG